MFASSGSDAPQSNRSGARQFMFRRMLSDVLAERLVPLSAGTVSTRGRIGGSHGVAERAHHQIPDDKAHFPECSVAASTRAGGRALTVMGPVPSAGELGEDSLGQGLELIVSDKWVDSRDGDMDAIDEELHTTLTGV